MKEELLKLYREYCNEVHKVNELYSYIPDYKDIEISFSGFMWWLETGIID